MGLTKGNDGNVTYLKLTKGAFFKSKDKEHAEPFTELGGRITDLYFKNEDYEGQTTRKIYTVVMDGNEKYIFGLSFESKLSTRFLGFLKNVDLSKDVVIKAGVEKEFATSKEVKNVVRTAIFIFQDGKSIKSAFTKENPNGLPKMKEIKVGNKKIWDKEEYMKFYEDLVVNDLKPKLEGQDKPTPEHVAEPLQDTTEDVDDTDNLPF